MTRLVHLVMEREKGHSQMMQAYGINHIDYIMINYIYYFLFYLSYVTMFSIAGSIMGLFIIIKTDLSNFNY